ncbi:MAG TPA: hypothetical protein VEV62_16060, partial [Parafilimonas sp.]|nr:hypothetical protein [Parafilimonas sp.]
MKFKRNSKFAIYSALLITCFFIAKFSSAQVDSTPTNAADSALLKQVEAQMQTATTEQPATAQPRSSLSFNPDIGVIGDFQSSYISK